MQLRGQSGPLLGRQNDRLMHKLQADDIYHNQKRVKKYVFSDNITPNKSQHIILHSNTIFHYTYVICFRVLMRKQYIFTCVSYAKACNRYSLDVRPSVTRWHCIKTAEYIVMLSSPHDSPFILLLFCAKFRRGHPLRGR